MPAWYVEYEGTTQELVREGADVIVLPVESTNAVRVYATPPLIYDPFTGARLLEWNAAAVDYVAVT